ncbi:MAG: hypothetical protein IJP29_02710 [Lachnospiraceae bacterium]|nr:hypothetical protein [Lachnospiraceae bacterium]
MEQSVNASLEQTKNADKKKQSKQMKDIIIIVVVVGLFFGGAIASIIFEEVRAFQSQDVKEMELYLEEIFYDDFDVEFHWVEYFRKYLGENQMPYLVEATMDDGSKVVFTAFWRKGGTLEYGVETTYEYNLIDHYAYKYGMNCDSLGGEYFTVEVSKEHMEGDNSQLHQFLSDLENTNYYYAGQTFYLYLEPIDGTGTSHRMELNWENPLDYEAVMKDLQMREK